MLLQNLVCKLHLVSLFSANPELQLVGASAGAADNNKPQDHMAPLQAEAQAVGAATQAPNAPRQGASHPSTPAAVVWERCHQLHDLFYDIPIEAQGNIRVSAFKHAYNPSKLYLLPQTCLCSQCVPNVHLTGTIAATAALFK